MARALPRSLPRLRLGLLLGVLLLGSLPLRAAPPPLTLGCDWMLAYDPALPDLGNTAFPETQARYWIAVLAETVRAPDRLWIDGRYPDARYAALHVHDGQLFTLDALSDDQWRPRPGSRSPWRDRTRRDPTVAPGGRYRLLLELDRLRPSHGGGVDRANTLYRPPPAALASRLQRRTVLAYRTYLPRSDNSGGVGLPRLVLETASGRRPLAETPDEAACAAIAASLVQDGAALPVSLLPPLLPEAEPRFRAYDGALGSALSLGVGFNPHNGFDYAKTRLEDGELLLVRGRRPSHSDQAGVRLPLLRYFSLCQYGAASQRAVACLPDRQLPADAQGEYTVAISSDRQRPALLAPWPEIGWLPRGPERLGVVSLRELLAREDFRAAIVHHDGQDPGRDGYRPRARYCRASTVQAAAGLGAAELFERCALEPPLRGRHR
ncbi:MAG TPA: hypothetical protein VFV27_08655 [Nevskiaceae bacterium]|nr:hypothetical protein [Nevskiaceae bacterium]